jgi:putative NADPH-quinone reductase
MNNLIILVIIINDSILPYKLGQMRCFDFTIKLELLYKTCMYIKIQTLPSFTFYDANFIWSDSLSKICFTMIIH